MKKLIIIIIAITMFLLICSCGSSKTNIPATESESQIDQKATENTINLSVTVSAAGEIVLTRQPVVVEDINKDGVFSLDEAVACAHKQYSDSDHEFVTENGAYGLCITKLWGVENGGSYGYYINNVAAMSLDDAVSENDYVVVYSYSDLDSWSDMYSWFDQLEVSGTELSLKLTAAGFDSNWNPIDVPVSNAKITVDGVITEAVTNEEGLVELVLSDNSMHIISAVSDDFTLVPPVCIANAE